MRSVGSIFLLPLSHHQKNRYYGVKFSLQAKMRGPVVIFLFLVYSINPFSFFLSYFLGVRLCVFSFFFSFNFPVFLLYVEANINIFFTFSCFFCFSFLPQLIFILSYSFEAYVIFLFSFSLLFLCPHSPSQLLLPYPL